MKRLIKAYSNNLKEPYIDSDMAMQLIEISDHECVPQKIHKDVNGMEAMWGAIDDSGKYILEIYLYDCSLVQKAAFVYDTIVNGQPSGNLHCLLVKDVSGASEAKREAVNGITGIDNNPVTFSNGYKSIDEVPVQEDINEENISVAASLRIK